MRQSQTAMLAAIGGVVAVMLASASWIALSAELEPEATTNEQRTSTPALSGFAGVDVQGKWDVAIERGDTTAVELSYPAAMENLATARVENGRLVIGVRTTSFRGGFLGRLDDGRNSRRLSARVTMPSLESLSVSGVAQTTFSGFEGSSLAAQLSGAADVRGSAGRYRDLDVALSGAGSLDLSDVVATNASVTLSGVGSIRLRLDGGTLIGNASGAGSIEYSGTVAEERVSKSGFVSVRNVN